MCFMEEDTGMSMLTRARFVSVEFFLLISWRVQEEQSEKERGRLSPGPCIFIHV